MVGTCHYVMAFRIYIMVKWIYTMVLWIYIIVYFIHCRERHTHYYVDPYDHYVNPNHPGANYMGPSKYQAQDNYILYILISGMMWLSSGGWLV